MINIYIISTVCIFITLLTALLWHDESKTQLFIKNEPKQVFFWHISLLKYCLLHIQLKHITSINCKCTLLPNGCNCIICAVYVVYCQSQSSFLKPKSLRQRFSITDAATTHATHNIKPQVEPHHR